jgi:hypothetical protein
MGFALFLGGEVAWCQGRHEYQPMGASVVSRTDLFRDRDFKRFRRVPQSAQSDYRGLFASLGEVNAFLRTQRAPAAGHNNRTKAKKSPGLQKSWG